MTRIIRRMVTTKTRHQFYLADELSARLDTLAAKPGASKTAILTDALTAWLDRAGAGELDAKFGPRFDRFTRSQGRSEDKLDTLTEMVGTFVQHQLTATSLQPPIDDNMKRLGSARFAKFMELVATRLARKLGGESH